MIDYGYRTTYATQNIATDGKYLYFAFYVADRKDPGIAVYDDKLEFVRVINAHAANGLVYDPTDHTLLKFRTRGGFADAVKIDIGDRPMRTEAVWLLSANAVGFRLHNVFTDHMVFQRNAPIVLTGTASPGLKVVAEMRRRTIRSSASSTCRTRSRPTRRAARSPATRAGCRPSASRTSRR